MEQKEAQCLTMTKTVASLKPAKAHPSYRKMINVMLQGVTQKSGLTIQFMIKSVMEKYPGLANGDKKKIGQRLRKSLKQAVSENEIIQINPSRFRIVRKTNTMTSSKMKSNGVTQKMAKNKSKKMKQDPEQKSFVPESFCQNSRQPVWRFQDNQGQWQNYDPVSSEELDRYWLEWKSGEAHSGAIKIYSPSSKFTYEIDFGSGNQKNMTTGKQRKISRRND